MDLIKNLTWRYATKRFDASKKIAAEDLEKLKEAVRLSASSYGLQLYKVLILEDPVIRERLKPVSWGQNQITEASHLVVFCNYSQVSNAHIEEYLALTADTRGVSADNLKGYGDFLKKKIYEKSEAERTNWTARQTYLALGNLLAACAELRIDACPMEGFEPQQYNQILGLSAQGLNAAVIAAIGYRSEEDRTQQQKKIRKPLDVLFEVK